MPRITGSKGSKASKAHSRPRGDPSPKSPDEIPYVVMFRASDQDYHPQGFFMARRRGDAANVFVGSYGHCSCNSSERAVQWSIDQEDWEWKGLASDFMRDIVSLNREMRRPDRSISPDDYDYDEKVAFYDACREWFKPCPPEMVDKDTSGLPILRLPRLYAKAHGATDLTIPQLSKLGKLVCAAVKPEGKCHVPGVPAPINRYSVSQYSELMALISEIRL